MLEPTNEITPQHTAPSAPVAQNCASTFAAGNDGPELARLREVERAAREFCARCERGEIRSVRSYERFRAALAGRWCDDRQS